MGWDGCLAWCYYVQHLRSLVSMVAMNDEAQPTALTDGTKYTWIPRGATKNNKNASGGGGWYESIHLNRILHLARFLASSPSFASSSLSPSPSPPPISSSHKMRFRTKVVNVTLLHSTSSFSSSTRASRHPRHVVVSTRVAPRLVWSSPDPPSQKSSVLLLR